MFSHELESEEFCAVVNSQGQYSLWQADTPFPLGWAQAGSRGTRAECLTYIEAHWVDQVPRSLRSRMWPQQGDDLPCATSAMDQATDQATN